MYPHFPTRFRPKTRFQASCKRFKEALDDAKKTVELKPDWPKGYSRLGAANVGLGDLETAVASYKKGLDVDPNNAQIAEALAEVEADLKSKEGGFDAAGNIGNMFSGPEVWGKIASNPQTSGYLADPTFVQMMQNVQKDPKTINAYLQDPRMMQVLGVLLGVNVMSGDQAKQEFAKEGDEEATSAPPPAPKAEPEPAKPEQPAPKEPELTEEERAEK